MDEFTRIGWHAEVRLRTKPTCPSKHKCKSATHFKPSNAAEKMWKINLNPPAVFPGIFPWTLLGGTKLYAEAAFDTRSDIEVTSFNEVRTSSEISRDATG